MPGAISKNRRLALRSLAHMFVDAICMASLVCFDAGFVEYLVYDTLAFTTQCITGMVADRKRGMLGFLAAASCALTAAQFFIPSGAMVHAVTAGIGNSFFHTSAGAEVLLRSEDRPRDLGVFVAPGSIGLVLGRIFCGYGSVYAAGCVACAVLFLLEPSSDDLITERRSGEDAEGGTTVLITLFCAVAVRAFGTSSASFSWNTGVIAALAMAAVIFLGKVLGGFAAERFDLRIMSVASVLVSAVLIAFCGGSPVLSLLGQVLINLTMPVTLWLMYMAVPSEPGFAFGLAAAALWPGVLTGMLFRVSGIWGSVCVLICFAAGAASILFAITKLEGKRDSNE